MNMDPATQAPNPLTFFTHVGYVHLCSHMIHEISHAIKSELEIFSDDSGNISP